MSKELTIDSNLWKKPNKIVKLSNLEFDKIKIVDAENNIEYDNGGFWLSISNLKGYFTWNGRTGDLKLRLNDQQERTYNKIWESITESFQIKNIVRKYGKEFIVYDNDLPVDQEFIINKIIIVIKSLYKHGELFYPQVSLNYCSYKIVK